MGILEDLDNDYDRAEALINILIARATGSYPSDDEFKDLKKYFYEVPEFESRMPRWLRAKRSVDQFWNFIQGKFPTYKERRSFIWDEFEALLSYCESHEESSTENEIEDVLDSFDTQTVARTWRLMRGRVLNDPEGAITSARSLIESVCKHILDNEGIEYNESKDELSELYRKVADHLNLSPSQHNEKIFKLILGNCSGVVSGLGSLRNKLGDAHGKSKRQVRPKSRHAKLAVNLSGAISQFLIETYGESIESED